MSETDTERSTDRDKKKLCIWIISYYNVLNQTNWTEVGLKQANIRRSWIRQHGCMMLLSPTDMLNVVLCYMNHLHHCFHVYSAIIKKTIIKTLEYYQNICFGWIKKDFDKHLHYTEAQKKYQLATRGISLILNSIFSGLQENYFGCKNN